MHIEEPITIIDEELPKPLIYSTNAIYAGVHFSKRKKIKDSYLWWFKTVKIPKLEKPLTCDNISFNFYFKKRTYDCDNCSYMSKMIIDCLVKNGYFLDDSPKYIKSITIRSEKGEKNSVKVSIL